MNRTTETHEAARCVRCGIRWMIRRDMAEVLAIEADEFALPWKETEFVRVLRNRNGIGMVAEWDSRVAGYMVYELFRTQIMLHNLAVSGAMQGRGVGRQLIEKLKSKLDRRRRSEIVAHVSERNLDAQLFFRAMGFRADKVVRGKYTEFQDLDAYRFVYRVCNGK